MIGTFSILVLLVMAATVYLGWSRKLPAAGVLAVGIVICHVLSLAGGRVGLVTPSGQLIGTRLLVHQELALPGTVLTDLTWLSPIQLFSHMFLHAGLGHLIGNLIVLLAFALPYEERIGNRRFLAIYFLSGLVAAGAQLVFLWDSPIIMLGASGAVFGIIGAFAARYPNVVVPLPLPLMIMMIFVRMRVIIAATIFFVLQVVNLQFLSEFDNTAYAAHLGGLFGGVLLGLTVRVPSTEQVQGKVTNLLPSLQAFAATDQSRRIVHQYQACLDTPELAQTWLDKFVREVRCPKCGNALVVHRNRLRCAVGHEAADLAPTGQVTAA